MGCMIIYRVRFREREREAERERRRKSLTLHLTEKCYVKNCPNTDILFHCEGKPKREIENCLPRSIHKTSSVFKL